MGHVTLSIVGILKLDRWRLVVELEGVDIYAENADGTYDIGDDVDNAGTAKLLKNGTVDSSLKGYIALSGKANV